MCDGLSLRIYLRRLQLFAPICECGLQSVSVMGAACGGESIKVAHVFFAGTARNGVIVRGSDVIGVLFSAFWCHLRSVIGAGIFYRYFGVNLACIGIFLFFPPSFLYRSNFTVKFSTNRYNLGRMGILLTKTNAKRLI